MILAGEVFDLAIASLEQVLELWKQFALSLVFIQTVDGSHENFVGHGDLGILQLGVVHNATIFVFFLITCFLALNLILMLFIGGIAFILGNQLIVQILQVPQVGDDS